MNLNIHNNFRVGHINFPAFSFTALFFIVNKVVHLIAPTYICDTNYMYSTMLIIYMHPNLLMHVYET